VDAAAQPLARGASADEDVPLPAPVPASPAAGNASFGAGGWNQSSHILISSGGLPDGNVGELPADGGLPLPAASSTPPQPLTKERLEDLKTWTGMMMPDNVEMMRQALVQAQDLSLSLEDRETALFNLQELVEDVDNAKDLQTIGGFTTVLELAFESEAPVLQAAAVWVIGTSVQNQRELQLHLVQNQTHTLPSLLWLLRSHASHQVRAKALYAIAGILSNCVEAKMQFRAENGVEALLDTVGEIDSPRLVRKALVLLTDLLDGILLDESSEERAMSTQLLSALRNASGLCNAIVQCLNAADLDSQEKAVQALDRMSKVGFLVKDERGTGSGCMSEEMRTAVQTFYHQCERRVNGAENDDSIGCDVLPLAKQLVGVLDA